MGDRGATGGAWGARDEASWWPGGAGEIQNQQQINEDIARSTAANTQQLYTYKMTGGFSNDSGGDNSTPSYGGYRVMSNSNTREESPQQQWWYGSGSVDSQQQNSSPTQHSPDPEQGSQSNGSQQNHLQQLQHQAQQEVLQQALQQNQQQSLQQMLQQQQSQQSQTLQQSIQQTLQVSQAQAQALVQAQQALQQQVAQSLQHQQQTLNDHIQAVQQQQIQAALQRQTATLQELQQQAQQQALIAQTTTNRAGRMPRAKIPNKPRGRMTAYAFFVQTCREEHKKKHPDENVIFAAFSKKCAERWNMMSEKEKARFHEMAEVDKKRYDLEMQSYIPPKDAVKVGRGRKRHTVKDPNAPKRSLSAFFWFCNDERSKVKAVNPEYTMGDIAKELGRRWAATEPGVKGKYEQLSEQDKARYDREMSAYKSGVQLSLAAPSQPEEVADFEEEEYN